MSRRTNTISFSKHNRKSKGGYRLNKNGVPLDSNDAPVMRTQNYHYNGSLHVGRYNVTMRNLTDI